MIYTPRAPQSRRLFSGQPVSKPGVVLGFVEYTRPFLVFTVIITLACLFHPLAWIILAGHWYLVAAQQRRGYHMALSGEADRITARPTPQPQRTSTPVHGLWMNGDPTRPKLMIDEPLRKAQKVAPTSQPKIDNRAKPTSSSSPVADKGWYADPSGGPVSRYWDGKMWTDDIASQH